jgi:inhibitor of KinA sporulation pathway (predicted exonuclease)
MVIISELSISIKPSMVGWCRGIATAVCPQCSAQLRAFLVSRRGGEWHGYPFGPIHLNIKSLFATAIGHDRELGLDGAYEILGLTMEGRHHRGDDDAWNIAILCRILQRLRDGM